MKLKKLIEKKKRKKLELKKKLKTKSLVRAVSDKTRQLAREENVAVKRTSLTEGKYRPAYLIHDADKKLTGLKQHLILRLIWHTCQKKGGGYVSLQAKTIAQKVGTTVPNVSKIVRQLKELGWIDAFQLKHGGPYEFMLRVPELSEAEVKERFDWRLLANRTADKEEDVCQDFVLLLQVIRSIYTGPSSVSMRLRKELPEIEDLNYVLQQIWSEDVLGMKFKRYRNELPRLTTEEERHFSKATKRLYDYWKEGKFKEISKTKKSDDWEVALILFEALKAHWKSYKNISLGHLHSDHTFNRVLPAFVAGKYVK